MKKIFCLLLFNIAIFCLPYSVSFAQSKGDTVVTLNQCIDFALRNQPAVKQSSIDQEINEKNIRIGLAAWLPQVSSNDQYQYYFKGSPAAAAADPSRPGTAQPSAHRSPSGRHHPRLAADHAERARPHISVNAAQRVRRPCADLRRRRPKGRAVCAK